ncbi:hypothetical protein E3N88_46267 [Mikania micrantha]|uniref:Protein kinase domain-containing protein n=1 Tax=Mikania micrantha TaxID=192012 RepID=A0A5N6L6S0_9ASTR|nr:hypothetical protein E3N88_46267 [Mikania micrantha]
MDNSFDTGCQRSVSTDHDHEKHHLKARIICILLGFGWFRSYYHDVTSSDVSHKVSEINRPESSVEQTEHMFPMKKILQMETNWYTSPEEAAGGPTSCDSDVYRLGVLLFELYYPCSSPEEKNTAMSMLKHRVFPPQLHFKWPKEAFFSMRLLHPEPTSRPKIQFLCFTVFKCSEVLQSEFLDELRGKLEEREAAINLEERLLSKKSRNRAANSGWMNPFMDGLSKYMSLSKLKVKADLKQGDLLNSSNLVWDVTQSQVSVEMREHERRAWSVDFSADPKLPSQVQVLVPLEQRQMCAVFSFPCDSSNFLAFGSADHRIYYHDLRNLSTPLCTLVGHKRTVSYIKFIDSKLLYHHPLITHSSSGIYQTPHLKFLTVRFSHSQGTPM